jgi:hypothetical protein
LHHLEAYPKSSSRASGARGIRARKPLSADVGLFRKACPHFVAIKDGFVVSNIGGGVTIVRGDGRRIETGEALRTPGPGIAQTASGLVFVVDYGGTGIHEVFDDGRTSLFVDGLSSPVGLTVSPSGDLFSADWGNGAVYRIRLA